MLFARSRTMNSNRLLRISPLCLLGMTLILPAAFANDGPSAGKPNIVLVVVDDLGWADLGCYGADLHRTPNIDRFAKTAVRFTDAYAAAPVCSPTRASIMTGQYPARLHMTVWRERALEGPRVRSGFRTAASEPNLPRRNVTLAEALRKAGYFTAHIGKWHLGGADDYPEVHGFDLNIGASLWGAPPTFFYPYRGPFGREREYRYVPRLEWGSDGEYLTDRLTSEAIETIRRVRDRPFFLHLAYHTVHTPIEAKTAVVERFRRGLRKDLRHRNPAYAAMVASLDENFGRLLATSRELELDDSTAVILVSDNGGYINDYAGRPVTNNHPLRSGKGSLYEGGVRVPLMIRAPGLSRAGAACSTPVITNDLYPTCLRLAEAIGTATRDGLSLLPLLREPKMKLDRDALFFHYPHFYPTTTPVSAVRAGEMKLLHFYVDGHDELYDLSTDLSEQRDLAESRPRQAKALRSRLQEWLDSVDARLPTRAEKAKDAAR